MSETDRDESDGRKLRVGGIDYLNSLPLLYGLGGEGDAEIELSNHPPSELADRLREGELDVALVPVVACADREDYVVLPDVAISSYGGVRSIRLFHRAPLEGVARVALDASSRTSSLLTRLFFRKRWGGSPEFETLPPDRVLSALRGGDPAEPPFDAALLIGDRALDGRIDASWNCLDLGTEWTRWTGLPFVYAFWVARTGPAVPPLSALLVDRFRRARDEGITRIDEIVREAKLPACFDPSDCRRYLSQVIRYDLDPAALEGLGYFLEQLREQGLLELPAGAPRFLELTAIEE